VKEAKGRVSLIEGRWGATRGASSDFLPIDIEGQEGVGLGKISSNFP
jgi:hypothetical protein